MLKAVDAAVHAIVLAGGRGTRLWPLTANRPKALAELAGTPVLEIVVRQLVEAGFRRLTLCVSHFSHMIEEWFADGSRFGIAIDYSHDTIPLGTAGPLRLVPQWESAALVMNCDVLTALDFRRVFVEHKRSRATLTIASRHEVVAVQTGVIDVDAQGRVRRVWEKPQLALDRVAGIYVMEPQIRALLPEATPMDMPQLIQEACLRDEPVRAHRFTDAWHDVGSPGQFQDARQAFLASPETFLGTNRRRIDLSLGTDDIRDHRQERDLAEICAPVRVRAAGQDSATGALTLRVDGDDLAGTT